MSKTKPWLPNAISPFIGAARVVLNAEQTVNIEEVLGAHLLPSDLADLEDIAGRYVALRQIELKPPLVTDWEAKLGAIEKHAGSLQDALQPFLDGDWAAERLRRLIDRQLGTMGLPKNQHVALSWLAADVDLLLRATLAARARLHQDGPLNDPSGQPMREVSTARSTFALDRFVGDLESFAEEMGVKSSSRKDGGASPFVRLIAELQKALPKECRITEQSIGALSRAISLSLQRIRRRDA